MVAKAVSSHFDGSLATRCVRFKSIAASGAFMSANASAAMNEWVCVLNLSPAVGAFVTCWTSESNVSATDSLGDAGAELRTSACNAGCRSFRELLIFRLEIIFSGEEAASSVGELSKMVPAITSIINTRPITTTARKMSRLRRMATRLSNDSGFGFELLMCAARFGHRRQIDLKESCLRWQCMEWHRQRENRDFLARQCLG